MAAAGLLASSLPWIMSSASAGAAPSASRFVAVAPCRLADTRTGEGFTRLSPHVIRVQAAGRCGIGASPSALALSVVMVNPGSAAFVSIYPTGTDLPNSSVVNFAKGQIRSNAAIVRAGADGSVDVYQATSGDIVLDTTGWFEPVASSAAGRFVPLAPTRLLDTRNSSIVAPGGSVTVPLPAGVPAGASALSLTITVTESSGPGFVTTYPSASTRPNASVLNLDAAGETRAAGGIHPVDAGGLTIYMSGGGHVVVDITGWFTGATASVSSAGLFTPTDPTRLLDTRLATPPSTGAPLVPGGTISVASPVGAATLAFNLTAVDGAPGFVTAYPAGTTRPLASNVNPAGGGDTVANFAIVPASSSGITLYTQQTTHLLFDLAGSFSAVLDSSPPVPSTTTTAVPTTTLPPTTTSSTTTTTTTTTTTSTTIPTVPGTTIPVNQRATVYLTFDDGPTPGGTQAIMSLLEQYGIKGTFFLVGNRITPATTSIAADVIARGHTVGNHSNTHPDLTKLTTAGITSEIQLAEASIFAATGRHPGCMRPPYGYVNSTVTSAIAAQDMTMELWTHDTNDWRTTPQDGLPATTVNDIVNVLNSMPTGAGRSSTVLMHDWPANTVTALQRWLPANIGRYNFAVLPSCAHVPNP
ncbi:MAG: polysaccharide deacetylase family protein [Acidimicrobiales bacterium]